MTFNESRTQIYWDESEKTDSYNIFKCYNSTDAYLYKDFYQVDCENPFLKNLSLLQLSHNIDVCELFNDPMNGDKNRTLFSKIKKDFQPFTQQIDAGDIEMMSLACPHCHHIQIINGQLYVIPRRGTWNIQTRSRSTKLLFKHVVDLFKSSIGDLDLFFSVGKNSTVKKLNTTVLSTSKDC